jgi:hypothetical protein
MPPPSTTPRKIAKNANISNVSMEKAAKDSD